MNNFKRFIIVVILVLVVDMLMYGVVDLAGKSSSVNSRFTVIETGGIDGIKYRIVCDNDTGVVYYISEQGVLSILYDTDQKPLLYGAGE